MRPMAEVDTAARVVQLLGGDRVLRHAPSTPAEIYAAAVAGIPYAALAHHSEHKAAQQHKS